MHHQPLPRDGKSVSVAGGPDRDRDRFVALAFCWADVVMELNDASIITFAAGAVERVTGCPPSSVIGSPFVDLFITEEHSTIGALMRRVNRVGRITAPALRLANTAAGKRSAQLSGYKIPEFSGRLFLALKMQDGTACGANTVAVRFDPESGTMTGSSFVDVVRQQVANGTLDETKSISVIAVPEPQALGTTLSERDKNTLISGIGKVLLANAGPPGLAGRVGDSRFAMVHAADLDVDEIRSKLDDILHQVAPETKAGMITATIAMDRTHLDDEQVADSLVFAINRFRAMRGRDFSLQTLRDQLSNLATEAVTSIHTLKKVLANGDFSLRFQPIVQTRTGVIHHYEALFRFSPDLNISSPFEHVCLAEHTGLITEFDMAVVRKAIAWLSEHADERGKIRIAVNLSGRSVVSQDFINELTAVLSAHTWTRQRLMFGLTESSKIEDLEVVNEYLQGFRRLGYPVCLDDFGAGASNFNYLSKLEIDFVKLDGAAVHLAASSLRGGAFVSAFVQLCRRLRVGIIAEMIEDAELLAFARHCGIPMIQGYFFGHPEEDISVFQEQEFRRKVSGERTLVFG